MRRNRSRAVSLWLVAFCAISIGNFATPQSTAADERAPDILKTESTFVWVPAHFRNRKGSVVSDVDLASVSLFDNGVARKVEKIDTSGLPISLVILMQTGGAGSQFLRSYDALPESIAPFVGSIVHEIMFVTFDSRVEQIWQFPSRTDGLDYAVRHQRAGDKGAAINDAVSFGIQQLQGEPGEFRRIILLISQETEEGSSSSLRSLLQKVGTSSTVVYSLTFPSERAHAPPRKKQGIDTAVKDPLIGTAQLLRTHTASEISILTGGSNFTFIDQPSFNSAMLQAASDFHDTVTLGFQPRCCEQGFHRIKLEVPTRQIQAVARQFYWRLPPD